jgi:hypothetical protein
MPKRVYGPSGYFRFRWPKLLTAVVACSLTVATSVTLHAALLVYEPFDYTEGSLAGQNGGIGWGSAWQAGAGGGVVPGSLSYGTLQTTGNSVVVNATSGALGSTFRTLSTAYGAGTYYVSFIGQRLSPHATLDENTIRASGFQLHAGTGTSADERIGAGKVTTASPNQTYNWSMFSDGSANFVENTTTPITDLAFIVWELEVADSTDGEGPGVSADIARMWVNPALGGSLGTPDVELNQTDANNHDYLFQKVRLFAGNANSAGPYASFAIDEIRIGETLADVTPVIPEPGTMLLAVLAMAGISAVRIRG